MDPRISAFRRQSAIGAGLLGDGSGGVKGAARERAKGHSGTGFRIRDSKPYSPHRALVRTRATEWPAAVTNSNATPTRRCLGLRVGAS